MACAAGAHTQGARDTGLVPRGTRDLPLAIPRGYVVAASMCRPAIGGITGAVIRHGSSPS